MTRRHEGSSRFSLAGVRCYGRFGRNTYDRAQLAPTHSRYGATSPDASPKRTITYGIFVKRSLAQGGSVMNPKTGDSGIVRHDMKKCYEPGVIARILRVRDWMGVR